MAVSHPDHGLFVTRKHQNNGHVHQCLALWFQGEILTISPEPLLESSMLVHHSLARNVQRLLVHVGEKNVIIKFAEDTTILGQITNNDEALTSRCQVNHLSLNISKNQ